MISNSARFFPEDKGGKCGTSTFPVISKTRQTISLVGWLAFCFEASATALIISTDEWYAGLHKPFWNPPSWLFGPVWTLLYVLMAVAAWMVWREGGWKAQWRVLSVFILQWLLNTLWTPLFFGMHRDGLALIDILLLWLILAATMTLFWRVKVTAGWLLLPYLMWVTFAAFLNYSIWRMNA
jgi:tryptophan-rich sensory protein